MRPFVKLIFILGICSKFVVPVPFTSDGYRKKANNTRDWLKGEISGGTSDRRYRNLYTQPRGNVPNDSQREINSPLHQQSNNANSGSNEDDGIISLQPLLSGDEALRKSRNQNNPPLQRNNFDLVQEIPTRDEIIPLNRMNPENTFKSSSLNRRPLKSKENFDTLNLEKYSPVNNIATGNAFNNENQANNRQEQSSNSDSRRFRPDKDYDTLNLENGYLANDIATNNNFNKDRQVVNREDNSVRLLQNNPLRFRDEKYNLSSASLRREKYKTQQNTVVDNKDDEFYFENEEQYKSRAKDQQQFPQVPRNIEPVDTGIWNINMEEENPVSKNNRPRLDSEDTFKENLALRRLESLNRAESDSLNYQNFSNEYNKSTNFMILTNNDEPSNTHSNNPRNEFIIPRNNQKPPFDTSTPSTVPVYKQLDSRGYDYFDSDLPIQQLYQTKSTLYTNVNYDPEFTTEKIFRSETLVPSDFNIENENNVNGLRSLQKQRKFQINPLKTVDNLKTLKETLNLPEENIYYSDKIFADNNSSFNPEEYVSNNKKVLSFGNFHGSKPTEKQIIIPNPTTDASEKITLDIEDNISKSYYNKEQDRLPINTKSSSIVQDSNSERKVYFYRDNGHLKNSQHGQTSLNQDNQKMLDNGNGKKIEIDINYVPSHKYDLSRNEHLLDTDAGPKFNVDRKLVKLLTTFTQGTDVKQILNNVNIQEHLKVFETKYIVVYPNGTVEHVDEIDSITAKFPNYVLIKSGNIITGQDGIDLKIQNNNYQNSDVPALPLVEIMNKKIEPKKTDEKTLNSKEEGRVPSITVENSQPNNKRIERIQKHVIPVILSSNKEKRTFDLNQNTPFIVDFSGSVEEIDINYNINDRITKDSMEQIKKNKKDTASEKDFPSDNGSNGIKSRKLNIDPAFDNGKNTPDSRNKKYLHFNRNNGVIIPDSVLGNELVNINADNSSSGLTNVPLISEADNSAFVDSVQKFHSEAKIRLNHHNRNSHGKQLIESHVEKVDIDKYTSNGDFQSDTFVPNTFKEAQNETVASKENVKELYTPNINQDSKISDKSSAFSNETNSNSDQGIISLFSGLFTWFSKSESSEDAAVKSGGEISNEDINSKKKDGSNQVTHDQLMHENSPLHKSGHSHAKKEKHRNSGENLNLKHGNAQLTDQNDAYVIDAKDNQGIDHIQKSGPHKHHSGSNFDNDVIITLSPIEVPQKNIENPIYKSGPPHVKKTKHRHSGGDSYSNQENIPLSDDEVTDTRDNQGIDLSRLITKSEPLVWYRGKVDGFVEQEGKEDGPDVMFLFEINSRPIIERDTKTTILVNGTMIKEFTEIIYNDNEDKEPTIVKTTKVIHPEQRNQSHIYPF